MGIDERVRGNGGATNVNSNAVGCAWLEDAGSAGAGTFADDMLPSVAEGAVMDDTGAKLGPVGAGDTLSLGGRVVVVGAASAIFSPCAAVGVGIGVRLWGWYRC